MNVEQNLDSIKVTKPGKSGPSKKKPHHMKYNETIQEQLTFMQNEELNQDLEVIQNEINNKIKSIFSDLRQEANKVHLLYFLVSEDYGNYLLKIIRAKEIHNSLPI